MAANLNFRSAFHGFNRQDVVQYIEYMNAKHSCAINQLQSEKQALADEIAQLRSRNELAETVAKLEAENAALAAQLADAQAAADPEMEAKLAEVTAQRDAALEELKNTRTISQEELEAYRRAERAERAAQERADQLYFQATGTLAQATTQVDDAAARFKEVADQVNAQLAQMQLAVESGKNALQDAAATMYAIRPQDAAAEASAQEAAETAPAEEAVTEEVPAAEETTEAAE